MIERREGSNAGFKQGIHKGLVEIESGLIGLAAAVWKNAWPGDGETISAQAEIFHDLDVLGPAMVVVAGYIGIAAVLDFSRESRKAVPYGFTPPSFKSATFDLLSRSGNAPEKSLGKAVTGHIPVLPG